MSYKNHFFISRAGNKRNEAFDLIKLINFNNKKNIIEPFCGTSAISFHIWLNYGDKFNYYLNDNSSALIELYELFRNESITKIDNEIKKISKKIYNKDDWKYYFKNGKNTPYKNLFFHKYSSMGRLGFFPINKKNLNKEGIELSELQLKFIDFIKSPNVFITNDDWFKSFNKFKDDKKAIIILDPPYINTNNDFYLDKDLNIYEYFYDKKNIKFKSDIYLILEDIWIIRLLFNNFKVLKVYEKKYELSKKKTNHIILFNH